MLIHFWVIGIQTKTFSPILINKILFNMAVFVVLPLIGAYSKYEHLMRITIEKCKLQKKKVKCYR